MEAWIHKKSLVIENLFSVTANLIESVEAEDWSQFDITLNRRSQLFSELQRIDQKFGTQICGEEAKWLNQLKQIDEMGRVLQSKMFEKKDSSKEALKRARHEKVEWVRENMLQAQGNSLEIKG